MKQGDLIYWVWLSERLTPGTQDFAKLAELYEDPFDLFEADETELERIPGLSERVITALADKSLTEASRILDRCQQLGISILTYADANFPIGVREIRNPPVLLYCAGNVPSGAGRIHVGMVGTRSMTDYGMQSAYRIAYELASTGAVIVSGLAEGIDGVCAAAAIKAGGETIAVLGCGLDIAYPKHHGKLMREIAKHGCLFSEYPPGEKPVSFHFPTRNRIISALSAGVVVVEAGLGSGSLITAKEAIVQGKDVFAVPANSGTAAAEGTNGLLRDGAHVALCAEDVLGQIGYLFAEDYQKKQIRSPKGGADTALLKDLGVIDFQKEVRKQDPRPPKTEAPKQSPKVSEPPKEKHSEPPKEKAPVPDAVMQSLSEEERAVLSVLPDDTPVTVEVLKQTELSFGEAIAALTMLEINGLVRKLPGAMYLKL